MVLYKEELFLIGSLKETATHKADAARLIFFCNQRNSLSIPARKFNIFEY